MSQFFESGGQSIGVSASALVLPKNIQDYCLNPRVTFVTVVQSLSVQLFVTKSMYCSTPGFPVLHYVPESAQTHAH